ncbi:acetyltransferase [Halorubrum saccharovorum]|uniref:Acetyltransferase n=1 Tax=Halorubrum saccharovorum TaxID=2248 RepID=A0A081EUZ0_9EURY|nr:GNAT family N-acetyltransferase [Halorubrum saccharovorum]KDS91228.1 acetyltransferase [Halorubrum saccharovorum]
MSGDRDRPDPPDNIEVEPAATRDRLGMLRVLDAAMLETDAESVDAAIDADDALVARFKRTDAVVGALIGTRPEPERLHVDAVAVRRARRGKEIGSTLVAEVVRQAERDPETELVTAEFDSKLEDFYTDLGFDAVPATDADKSDRLRGRRQVNAEGDCENPDNRRD